MDFSEMFNDAVDKGFISFEAVNDKLSDFGLCLYRNKAEWFVWGEEHKN